MKWLHKKLKKLSYRLGQLAGVFKFGYQNPNQD